MRGPETERSDAEVDEYLWPLTGELSSIDWQLLTEELHIRERLAEIRAHVHETHVHSRLRRLGTHAGSAVRQAVTQTIIAGPEDGAPWAQTLKEPVPRALRAEWDQLAERLRVIAENRYRSAPTRR